MVPAAGDGAPENSGAIGGAVLSDIAQPITLPPTFQDRVRFRIAVGMRIGVAGISVLLIGSVAAGLMTTSDVKELALAVVALFGIVAPIIGFYFAAKERG
jgi:hypothetical protein